MLLNRTIRIDSVRGSFFLASLLAFALTRPTGSSPKRQWYRDKNDDRENYESGSVRTSRIVNEPNHYWSCYPEDCVYRTCETDDRAVTGPAKVIAENRKV